MAQIYRAIVTPTKIYIVGPDPEVSNRVLRHYSQHLDRFLRVTFMDENFGPIGGEYMSSSISKRIKKFIEKGTKL